MHLHAMSWVDATELINQSLCSCFFEKQKTVKSIPEPPPLLVEIQASTATWPPSPSAGPRRWRARPRKRFHPLSSPLRCQVRSRPWHSIRVPLLPCVYRPPRLQSQQQINPTPHHGRRVQPSAARVLERAGRLHRLAGARAVHLRCARPGRAASSRHDDGSTSCRRSRPFEKIAPMI